MGTPRPVDGRFPKPRAMAIDAQDRIYIVDMTARIQVFDAEGKFLRGWQTPDHVNGRPTGLSHRPRRQRLVADTHYYRVLVYSPDGEAAADDRRHARATSPGEFGLVTDVVAGFAKAITTSPNTASTTASRSSRAEGKFVLQWGGHGAEPGQFVRPQKHGHRRRRPHLGRRRLQPSHPGLRHARESCSSSGARKARRRANCIILTVWCSTPDGTSTSANTATTACRSSPATAGRWAAGARHGRQQGQLHNPWALVRDSRGTIHVLDTENHRVQQVRM